jgi:hypothetical protein
MNYLKIYKSIINKAKSRNLTKYNEKHHIIPKCMNGTNDKTNIVKLTPKEHFICHRLLSEIYPNNNGLKYALWCMIHMKNKNQNRNYKISSKTYNQIKIEISKINSENNTGDKNGFYGKKHTKETIKILSDKRKGIPPSNKGIPLTYEHKQKISKSKTGKPISESTKIKLRKHKHTKETKLKMSKSHIGKPGTTTGKKFSDETKKRMSDAQKKRHKKIN